MLATYLHELTKGLVEINFIYHMFVDLSQKFILDPFMNGKNLIIAKLRDSLNTHYHAIIFCQFNDTSESCSEN